MTALFELPIITEYLSPEEVQGITGVARKGDQVAWLEAHGWRYVRNRAGEPIVGRMYARLMLAGIDSQGAASALSSGVPAWEPDFSRL